MMEFENIANKIIACLAEKNIKAYLWCVAETTNSVYIRFEDPRMCSIRLSDHAGKKHLKYKYNLLSGISKDQWVKDDGTWRYFLPMNRWKEIIPIMEKRAEQVKSWPERKFDYKIPSFKQKQK